MIQQIRTTAKLFITTHNDFGTALARFDLRLRDMSTQFNMMLIYLTQFIT